MNKQRVLFICVHNSARSQMAEAFLDKYAGGRFEVESAGIQPGKLNPIVVDVMREAGLDISQNKTKGVFDLYQQGKQYDYVIAVCDESQSSACPVFPGKAQQLHWAFPDPSKFEGTNEEKLEKVRVVRDSIKQKIQKWLEGDLR
jgi:arsenate reductase (thioredoxin)